jgi:hypothetical protein
VRGGEDVSPTISIIIWLLIQVPLGIAGRKFILSRARTGRSLTKDIAARGRANKVMDGNGNPRKHCEGFEL